MEYLLEVIAFDIESCRLIEDAGGGRIELCANPAEGGTTVSYGMLKAAREAVSIPVFPIIRPRGGDFLYNEQEYEIMVQDVKACREFGMDGVVLGLLTTDGDIDSERLSRLVELAYPMELTFHRAFDHCREPLLALETIVDCGCTRILTSGGAPTAGAGLELLQELVLAARDRIVILPGSGIRSGNIASLARSTGLEEFHSSARTQISSSMKFRNPAAEDEQKRFTVDPEEIKACMAALGEIKN